MVSSHQQVHLANGGEILGNPSAVHEPVVRFLFHLKPANERFNMSLCDRERNYSIGNSNSKQAAH